MINTPAETGAESPTGAERITAERQRQIKVEGYDAAHDTGHTDELTRAAQSYLWIARHPEYVGTGIPSAWPWASRYWKPSPDTGRNLEKAGALIAAAIDSLEAQR